MEQEKSGPSLYIIAGPNGAGKTTFAREFLPHFADCKEFVNADLIAQGLAPFAPETAALRAGRLVLERIDALSRQRADFGLETTLSGRAYAPLFRRLKAEGYRIYLFFLWLPEVDRPWPAWPTGCGAAAIAFRKRMSAVVIRGVCTTSHESTAPCWMAGFCSRILARRR